MEGESAKHIIVDKNSDGTYKVVGGEANNDKGIYLNDGKGGKGQKVGNMKTTHSFFDEKNKVVKGAVLDPKSNAGQNFVNGVAEDDPSLPGYMWNARNGKDYDFKDIGIESKKNGQTDLQYRYRGSVDSEGNFGSARDFGNFAAGMVAARKGLTWFGARLGFDTYQGYKDNGFSLIPSSGGPLGGGIPTIGIIPVRECKTSINAEWAGYSFGLKKFPQINY
jgi:hypothetical protein